MDILRLRSLTTGKLHTDVGHVYQDLEFITGVQGFMTHQLPNVMRAVEPWLKENVLCDQFWNGEYNPELIGDFDIQPMTKIEREKFEKRYAELPHPFSNFNKQSA
jgi:hypothetical protein